MSTNLGVPSAAFSQVVCAGLSPRVMGREKQRRNSGLGLGLGSEWRNGSSASSSPIPGVGSGRQGKEKRLILVFPVGFVPAAGMGSAHLCIGTGTGKGVQLCVPSRICSCTFPGMGSGHFCMGPGIGKGLQPCVPRRICSVPLWGGQCPGDATSGTKPVFPSPRGNWAASNHGGGNQS